MTITNLKRIRSKSLGNNCGKSNSNIKNKVKNAKLKIKEKLKINNLEILK